MTVNFLNKSFSKNKYHEIDIFEIIICNLENTSEDIYRDDDEIYDFEDIETTFPEIVSFFFNNNFHEFEINPQFRFSPKLNFHDKTIKLINTYCKMQNLTIHDCIKNKYINNKKTRIPDNKNIQFIKEMNKYKSVLDYKIYKNKLTIDEILHLYKNQFNKNVKKYFRFKLLFTNYSEVLEEHVSFYMNYICEIPKQLRNNFKNDNSFLYNHDWENNVEEKKVKDRKVKDKERKVKDRKVKDKDRKVKDKERKVKDKERKVKVKERKVKDKESKVNDKESNFEDSKVFEDNNYEINKQKNQNLENIILNSNSNENIIYSNYENNIFNEDFDLNEFMFTDNDNDNNSYSNNSNNSDNQKKLNNFLFDINSLYNNNITLEENLTKLTKKNDDDEDYEDDEDYDEEEGDEDDEDYEDDDEEEGDEDDEDTEEDDDDEEDGDEDDDEEDDDEEDDDEEDDDEEDDDDFNNYIYNILEDN